MTIKKKSLPPTPKKSDLKNTLAKISRLHAITDEMRKLAGQLKLVNVDVRIRVDTNMNDLFEGVGVLQITLATDCRPVRGMGGG